MPDLTEGRHAAEFVLTEANGMRSRDTITIASGSGILAPGTVLGKLTSGGQYKPATNTGSDGGQIAVALNLYEVDASSAAVKVAAITGDAEVNKNLITYGATIDNDAKKATAIGQLAGVGIKVR